MTALETVRAAASELPQPFTFGALLISCWKRDEAFALADAGADHPDARKLQNVLYGKRGSIGRGDVVRFGELFYARGMAPEKPTTQARSVLRSRRTGYPSMAESHRRNG